MKKYTLLLITALALLFTPRLAAQDYIDDVMLQSFGWDEFQQQRHSDEGSFYNFYYNHAQELKNAGFDMVWFPPPSVSTGGVGYFPTELFNFSQTSWGSEAQLNQMLSRYNSLGMYPIADIVANHRSGTTGWTDFTNPDWPCSVIVSNDDAWTDPNYPGTFCGGTNADTGEEFPGSRDIDQSLPIVQQGYKDFLDMLKAKGFKGWRYDVAKGFDPKYFGEYNYHTQPYLSVGEYLDGSVPLIRNWIDATIQTANPSQFNTITSSAFDFPLYFTLSRAIKNNNWGELQPGGVNQMPGVAGQFGFAYRAITLVDNHDTFVYSDGFIGDEIPRAYAYILTHPGVPSVFAPHYYGGTYAKDGQTRTFASYQKQINEMIAVRKAAGIDANSHLTIESSGSFYAATIKQTASDANPVIAVKIGPGAWSPSGAGWVLNTSGNDYAIWSKQAINKAPEVTINPATTTFAAGSTINISISATDPEAQSTTIYYTTDGSEPTTSSTQYTAGFSVTESTFVKAIAVDSAGKQSPIASKYYRIAGDITVYFNASNAPTGFVPPYIHYWNAQPTGAIADAVWTSPVAMNPAPDQGPGWYSYTFNNITSVNVLFRTQNAHVGTSTVGGTQTGDVVGVNEDSWYEWDTAGGDFVKQVNLSTTEVVKDEHNMKLSPNPTTGLLQISSKNPIVNANVYAVTGAKVMSATVQSNQLNVKQIPAGIYVLQATDSKGNTTTAKFIKK